MSHISASLRARVIARAGGRCEYCLLLQEGQAGTFHIDHIIPEALDGPTTFENLALACPACSLRKGYAVKAFDLVSQEHVRLFNPRSDTWEEHFEMRDYQIIGTSPIGRASCIRLVMNAPLMVSARRLQGFL